MKVNKNVIWRFFVGMTWAASLTVASLTYGTAYAEHQIKAEDKPTKASPGMPSKENKSSQGLTLDLIIPKKIKQGGPISVTVHVWNKGDAPLKFVYPYGADKNGLFSYELSEMNTHAKWEVKEHSLRSIVKDQNRMIPKNSAVELEQDSLKYKKDNDWQTTLPVGRYQMVVIYNPQKAMLAEDRVGTVIQSTPVEFTVE